MGACTSAVEDNPSHSPTDGEYSAILASASAHQNEAGLGDEHRYFDAATTFRYDTSAALLRHGPGGVLFPSALLDAAGWTGETAPQGAGLSPRADGTVELARRLSVLSDDLATARSGARVRGLAGQAQRMLTAMRSLMSLKSMDLGSLTSGPISMYMPASTVEMLTWHSHTSGRAPPLARLALRMRIEAAAMAADVKHLAPPAELRELFAALRCQLSSLDLPAPMLVAPLDSVQNESSRVVRVPVSLSSRFTTHAHVRAPTHTVRVHRR